MKSKKKREKVEKDAVKISKDRIAKLLHLSKEVLKDDEELSKRYVKLARKIAMRHRIKLGNRLFCKKCNTYSLLSNQKLTPKKFTIRY